MSHAPVSAGESPGLPDYAALSHAQRVDTLIDLQRQMGCLQAQEHRLLAVMAADPPAPAGNGLEDKHWVREDVACALRLSFGHASTRLQQATELARVPDILALLEHGTISSHHARAVAEAIDGLSDQDANALTARVTPQAGEQNLAAFKTALRRALLTLTPTTEEHQRLRNVTERRVSCRPAGTGVSTLWALLPEEGAAALMAAIHTLATHPPEPGDHRTLAQREADALIHLSLNTLTGQPGAGQPGLPAQQRLRPAIQVSVAQSTLLGLDDQPGELAGIGPIPAALARQLAADPSGTWRRLLTDPAGHLIDYGRRTYRPPTTLSNHITARDQTCRFPHCTRPATHCDLDHTRNWAHHGHTNQHNLSALCPRHHQAKHQAGWTYHQTPTGTTTWTSPTGHTYHKPPTTYPIDHTNQHHQPDQSTDHPPDDPDPPPF